MDDGMCTKSSYEATINIWWGTYSIITVITTAWLIYMVASKCSWNHFISEKYKIVQYSMYSSFKIVPMCNYTLLPETVKFLETSLEFILWKPL